MQNEIEAEKLPRPQIVTRVVVYTVDQGTTNPVGAYPGGLTFLAKDAQCPIPAEKDFYPKLDNPLLTPWVSRGCPGGRPPGKLMISALAWSSPSGAWKSDKQVRHNRKRCIDSFKHIFLSAILHVLFRATNSLFKSIILLKEQFEAEIAKKLRTAQSEPKVTGSYIKKKGV